MLATLAMRARRALALFEALALAAAGPSGCAPGDVESPY